MKKIKYGIGIDPFLDNIIKTDRYILLPGYFPDALKKEEKFDAITMLAVIEHIPKKKLSELANIITKYLHQAGKLIITVPSPKVDHIIDLLMFLKILDGMDVDAHYGYDYTETEKIFTENGFLKLIKHQKFQLGLNNLFVFEKQ